MKVCSLMTHSLGPGLRIGTDQRLPTRSRSCTVLYRAWHLRRRALLQASVEPAIQVDTAVATNNPQQTADRLAAYRSAGSLKAILQPLALYLEPSSPVGAPSGGSGVQLCTARPPCARTAVQQRRSSCCSVSGAQVWCRCHVHASRLGIMLRWTGDGSTAGGCWRWLLWELAAGKRWWCRVLVRPPLVLPSGRKSSSRPWSP